MLQAQVNAVVTAATDVQKQVADEVPATLAVSKVNFGGLKPDTAIFAGQMADLQDKNTTALGDLPTKPDRIRTVLSLAKTAHAARVQIMGLVNLLGNIESACLREANHDGNLIYHRAVAVAPANTAVEEAISQVRDARSRIGKKGAHTRKARAGKGTPPTQPTTTPSEAAPGTTTTTTTSR